ncbi:hypothetical protein LINGRAHAP2_LOCUS7678, partial [Linum grandiflorum]
WFHRPLTEDCVLVALKTALGEVEDLPLQLWRLQGTSLLNSALSLMNCWIGFIIGVDRYGSIRVTRGSGVR